MLKIIRTFIITLTITLAACERNIPSNPPVLMSGAELVYTSNNQVTACFPRGSRPIMWLDDKTPTGVSVETLRAVASKINLNVKFIDKVNQAQVIEDFQAGLCDIATGVKETPERAEFMDFTQPYLFIGTTMLVRQPPIKFPMRVGFGRKFGVASTVQKFGGQLDVVEFASDRDSFKALVANDISAIVIDELTAHQLEKENNIKFARVGVDFFYDIAFGYQPNNPMLGELLRKGLANLTIQEKAAIYEAEIAK